MLRTQKKKWNEKLDSTLRNHIKKLDSTLRNHFWDFLGGTVLRICLPMQGTQVRALVREDPTCCRAAKPMRHNYRAYALEPASHNY